MNYFGKLFLKTNAIGYGCLVLLGSVSVAGITELEVQKQLGSKGGKSIGSWFSSRGKNVLPATQQTGQQITFADISRPFIYAGEQVSSSVSSTWPYVQAGFSQIKSSITSIDQIGDGLKRFGKSLFDPDIFKQIFKDGHLKIGKVLSFTFAGGKRRGNFAKLFQKEKKETTETVIKFLLGMEHKGSDYFKSNPKVFNYLLSRGMDDPERITDKFDRLSNTIERLIKKSEEHGKGRRGNAPQGQKNTYTLEVPTVQQYLDVEEGIPELFFNVIWAGEVASKIKFGKDLTGESKSLVSGLFKSPR